MTRLRAGLLAALSASAWLAMFGDKTPMASADIAIPTRSPSPPAPAMTSATVALAQVQRLTTEELAMKLEPLSPRDELIPARGPEAATRNPFVAMNWTPPPAPAQPASASPPPPPPAPTAPPLPYTVLGKKIENGTWEVYLGRADQVFVANIGTTIEGAYKVERIQPPNMQLLYLPLGQQQTVSIGDSE